ncbi:MAG: hypothetical protein HZB95_07705 [Nitrosomonadales bacterium]|nr:hypothetical protein [Nitrosomonadales bacterium]
MSSSSGGVERRTNPHLRGIFEEAYHVAEPMLGSGVSSSAHFLRITLHDAFPDLHQQDISILCVAIERVHRERSKVQG